MKNKRIKTYSCRVCGEAMLLTTGHTQYYGARYCPQQQRISRAEWMEKMRRERNGGIKKTNMTVKKKKNDKRRKTYTCGICGICGKPAKSAWHSCYNGVRYCPNKPEQVSFEEWLTQRHIERIQHLSFIMSCMSTLFQECSSGRKFKKITIKFSFIHHDLGEHAGKINTLNFPAIRYAPFLTSRVSDYIISHTIGHCE